MSTFALVLTQRVPGSTPEALALKAPLFTWSVKSDSCYNVPRLCSARCMKQTLWSSADHALTQVWPRYSHILKKWSHMQSRALIYIYIYIYICIYIYIYMYVYSVSHTLIYLCTKHQWLVHMGTVILDTSKTVATEMEIQFLNTWIMFPSLLPQIWKFIFLF